MRSNTFARNWEFTKNEKDLIINSTIDLKLQKNIESSVKNNMKNVNEKVQVTVVGYDGAVRALCGETRMK